MKTQYTVTVLVPVYRPDRTLHELLRRLSCQKMLPDRVILLNTTEEGIREKSGDEVSECAQQYKDLFPSFSVLNVEKSDFDHGATRDLGFRFSDTDLVLCMTQDALPRDTQLIGKLAAAFDDPLVAAAYGRQLPKKMSGPLETYSRQYNYPGQSCVKGLEDLDKLGIKTFFCSDVCAMWRRDTYFDLGGFEARTIFNEDMILAGHLIRAGYRIAYVAEAQVYHSHSYSGIKQLKRNFDLGVSQADHPEVFSMVSSAREGIGLVKETAVFLIKSGKMADVGRLVWQSSCKFLGYKLGKNYKRLPGPLILKLTDNPSYWGKCNVLKPKPNTHRTQKSAKIY